MKPEQEAANVLRSKVELKNADLTYNNHAFFLDIRVEHTRNFGSYFAPIFSRSVEANFA